MKVERSVKEIYEHAEDLLESLWDDKKVPAIELEVLVFSLMHMNNMDIESITTIFDSVTEKYKTLQRLRMEDADNVIPFPVKR